MAWTDPITHSVGFFVDAPDWNDEITENNKCQVAPASATIADLNTLWGSPPPDGATGRLKLGTSPYDFIDLIYSDDLAKWVSTEAWYRLQASTWTVTMQPVATSTPIGGLAPLHLLPWAPYDAAGLAPQAKLTGLFASAATGAGGPNDVTAIAYTADNGDTSLGNNALGFSGASATSLTGTPTVHDTPWASINAGTVTDYLSPSATMTQAGGGGETANFTAASVSFGLRWVGS